MHAKLRADDPGSQHGPLDGVAADLIAEVIQRPDQPRVPPGWVLRRHLNDELFHVDGHGRTPCPAACRAVVLAGDQLAVTSAGSCRASPGPRTPRAGADRQPVLDGQPSPLVVGEAQPPAGELLAEHMVLLAQEVVTSSWRELIPPAIQTTRNRTASVPIAAPW
jgi:hypothetical protein